MPDLSVVVPIYNVAGYLPRCIDSILDQTFADLELILVNDGSTDGSKEICDYYATKDDRVFVINKKNSGVSDSRNIGLKAAHGEYIAFVDGDDYLDLEMYQTLIRLCKENNAEISTCMINSGKSKVEVKQSSSQINIYNKKEAIYLLYKSNIIGFSVCNKVFKRRLFQDVRFPKGRIYEDAAVLYRILDNANKVVLMEQPLYYYTSRDFSITRSSFSEKRFDIVDNYYETYDFMKDRYPELSPLLTEGYYFSLKGIIADCTNDEHVLKKMNYVKRACKEIKAINKKMKQHKLLDKKQSFMANILGWWPLTGFIYYKMRGRIAS